jgi:hypothetical protein
MQTNTRIVLRLAMILTAVTVVGASTSCLGGSRSEPGSTSTGATPSVVSDSGPPRVLLRPAVASPLRIAWPSDAASGFGSIWVSAAAGLTKLDPRSGRVVGTIKIANDGEWTNVAVGGGSVWFGGGGMIARVDPTSGRVLSRTNFRAMSAQAFEWIGANSDGFCTTQLVAKAGRATFCFDTNLKRRFVARAGPGPIAATTSGDIWVGGPTLSSIDIRTHTTQSLASPRGSRVSALAPDGAGLWAAVEFHRGKAAEIWHIVDRRVVSRIPIDATWVENVAFADGALVVVPYRIGEARPTAEAVAPDGKLRHVATLAKDNHNVLGTPDALWTISYRRNLVTKVSQFASPAP